MRRFYLFLLEYAARKLLAQDWTNNFSSNASKVIFVCLCVFCVPTSMSAVAYLLLVELGDGRPLLDFSNNFAMPPPPLGGDFLGEDYRLFERAVAMHFLCESKQNCSLIFFKLAPHFEK